MPLKQRKANLEKKIFEIQYNFNFVLENSIITSSIKFDRLRHGQDKQNCVSTQLENKWERERYKLKWKMTKMVSV